jgi:hypothetical protein
VPALIGCLILNSGMDIASSTEYQISEAFGANEALSASVALGSDAKTLLDLSEVYGPPVAVWLPLGACTVSHVVEWVTQTPGLSVYSSALVAGLAWWTKRSVKISG